jgi:hypothetical protein
LIIVSIGLQLREEIFIDDVDDIFGLDRRFMSVPLKAFKRLTNQMLSVLDLLLGLERGLLQILVIVACNSKVLLIPDFVQLLLGNISLIERIESFEVRLLAPE